MKSFPLAIKTLSFVVLSAAIANGQSNSVSWFKIAGGGGTSTGGIYAVAGTIGQPDAGRISSGNFSIAGGFWGTITAIQSPAGPPLRIFRTGTNTVVLAWPASSTGFTLQRNAALDSANWTGVTNPIDVVDEENQIILDRATSNQFYRLKSP